MEPDSEVLFVISSYNEADWVADVISDGQAAAPKVHGLETDDASSDETGVLTRRLRLAPPTTWRGSA